MIFTLKNRKNSKVNLKVHMDILPLFYMGEITQLRQKYLNMQTARILQKLQKKSMDSQYSTDLPYCRTMHCVCILILAATIFSGTRSKLLYNIK